jgi:hypothetical protein
MKNKKKSITSKIKKYSLVNIIENDYKQNKLNKRKTGIS